MTAGPGFTLWGDERAEARVQRDLALVAHEVRHRLGGALCALLLLGGYARGEGGVVLRDGEPAPFNDYDFVAVVARGAVEGSGLAACERVLSEQIGVAVDLFPVREDRLARVPATLLWLDASLGGVRLVEGDPRVLARLRRLGPRDVPLDEAGRLLANRAVGLALSNLEPVGGREGRLARHGHKAALACGDAVLLAAARYRPTLAERLRELERLAGAPRVPAELVARYADAVRFRRRPDLWRPAGGDLAAWYREARTWVARWHLDYEAWRVGAPRDPADFARWKDRLYPRMPDVRRFAAVASAVRLARAGAAPLWPFIGHPRERLARVGVALAYGIERADCLAAAARLLGLPSLSSEPAARSAAHARVERLARLAG